MVLPMLGNGRVFTPLGIGLALMGAFAPDALGQPLSTIIFWIGVITALYGVSQIPPVHSHVRSVTDRLPRVKILSPPGKGKPAAEPDLSPEDRSALSSDIQAAIFVLEHDAKTKSVSFEGFHEAVNVILRLGLLKVPIPLLPIYDRDELQYDRFSAALLEYLLSIAPYVRSANLKTIKAMSRIAIEVIFEGDDPTAEKGPSPQEPTDTEEERKP